MKQSFKPWILLSVPFFISGCGSMKIPDVSIPMLNGEYRELSSVPKDASLYQCEKNKKVLREVAWRWQRDVAYFAKS